MGLFCILSPIFVNWVGVKKTLIFGTLGWSVYSAALYQNNRYGTEWFVIFGAAICGVSAGLYWAAEGAIVLSYPEYAKRGRYLALWLAFKNSGQLIGGAINLGLNASRSGAGKVSYVTILVFVGLQASAVPFSFALSPPEKTERPDGSKIVVEKQTSAKEQLRRLWKTVSTRQIGLLLPIFFSCWFYWVRLNEFFFVFFWTLQKQMLILIRLAGLCFNLHHPVLFRPGSCLGVLPLCHYGNPGLHSLWHLPGLEPSLCQDPPPLRLRLLGRLLHPAVDLGLDRAA